MRWAYAALGSPEHPWAVDALLQALSRTPRKRDWWDVARALATQDAKRAVPTLIAVIAADGTYDAVYGVGHFGLTPLTSVPYDASHDGPWWRAWWTDNAHRLAPDLQGLPIPTLDLAAR